jgi:O-acetylserine/cysteine efflux transporter
MRGRDVALAVLVSLIWGFSYVTYKAGLNSFSPAQLSAVRFIFACVALLFVPRPKVSWIVMLTIGLVMFAGQFLLLMLAYARDMPAGLGSVTQQTQAVFTIVLAAIFMREFPTLRQGIGMTVAIAGLVLIGFTIGGDLKPAALALALAAALSWAIGNIVVKHVRGVSAFALMALPAAAPSGFGRDAVRAAVAGDGDIGVGAAAGRTVQPAASGRDGVDFGRVGGDRDAHAVIARRA